METRGRTETPSVSFADSSLEEGALTGISQADNGSSFLKEGALTGRREKRRPKISSDNYVTVFLPDRLMKPFREMQNALHLTASELGRRMMTERLHRYAEERLTERKRAASRAMECDEQLEMPQGQAGADE